MEKNTGYERVKELYQDEKHYSYHLNQFNTPYRSTILLAEFIKRCVKDVNKKYKIIDVGCGGGANIHYLSKIFANSSWIGIDFADKFFEIGKKAFEKKNDYRLIKYDFLKLNELFQSETFDIVLSIQTLSWLPSYEEALAQLLSVANNWVFISSLFTECNVDIINNVYVYEDEKFKEGNFYNYNIYSLNRFRSICEKNNFTLVDHEEFIIDTDILKNNSHSMGTYTIKDSQNKRLQFSGPLYLPWRFLCLKKK